LNLQPPDIAGYIVHVQFTHMRSYSSGIHGKNRSFEASLRLIFFGAACPEEPLLRRRPHGLLL